MKHTLEVIRDELVAEKNGVIKYQPMLIDMEQVLYNAKKRELNIDELARLKKEVREQSILSHDKAMQALKKELAEDPENLGYKGKTPEEIIKLLTHEIEIYQEAYTNEHGHEFPRVLKETKPPRVAVIWSGITYVRNVPKEEHILEALV